MKNPFNDVWFGGRRLNRVYKLTAASFLLASWSVADFLLTPEGLQHGPANFVNRPGAVRFLRLLPTKWLSLSSSLNLAGERRCIGPVAVRPMTNPDGLVWDGFRPRSSFWPTSPRGPHPRRSLSGLASSIHFIRSRRRAASIRQRFSRDDDAVVILEGAEFFSGLPSPDAAPSCPRRRLPMIVRLWIRISDADENHAAKASRFFVAEPRIEHRQPVGMKSSVGLRIPRPSGFQSVALMVSSFSGGDTARCCPTDASQSVGGELLHRIE